MIVEISIEGLCDSRQIGWVKYREGNAVLSLKVIRSRRGHVFLAHQTAYRDGENIQTVEYPNRMYWNKLKKLLLEEFRRTVGEDYFFNAGRDA